MSEEEKQGLVRGDTVVLTDVDDNEVELQCEEIIEYEGKSYGLFSPVEEMEDIEEDEVIILQFEEDKDGELVFNTIEDEKLIEKIYDIYSHLVDEYNEHCHCDECEDEECDCCDDDEECDCNDEHCDCGDEHCDCKHSK